MQDVPLKQAQIIWDREDLQGEPPVKVIAIPGDDDDRYIASWGACNSEFIETDDAGRLLMLFAKFHQLVTLYGLEPKAVDEALMVIPEYRAALVEAGTIPPDIEG